MSPFAQSPRPLCAWVWAWVCFTTAFMTSFISFSYDCHSRMRARARIHRHTHTHTQTQTMSYVLHSYYTCPQSLFLKQHRRRPLRQPAAPLRQPAAPLQSVMNTCGPLPGTAVFVDTFRQAPGLLGGVFFFTRALRPHARAEPILARWQIALQPDDLSPPAFGADVRARHHSCTRFKQAVLCGGPAAPAPNAHWRVCRRQPLPWERHFSPGRIARRPTHFDGRLSAHHRSPPQSYVGWVGSQRRQSDVVLGRHVCDSPPCLP